MKKAGKPLSDRELDALFDGVRRDTPAPPASLVSKVLANAADITAARQPTPVPLAPGGRHSWFAAFLDGLGGWQGAVTVAASGMFGLWVGYADLAKLPLIGNLSSEIGTLLNGDAGLEPITTFDDFRMEK